MGLIWEPDYLGGGFTCAEFNLGSDDEGPCVATLVSYSPPTVPAPTGPPASDPKPTLASSISATLGGWRSRFLNRTAPADAAAGPEAGAEPQDVAAVLYLHGWSDYFMHRGLAEFYAERGVAFYALDLRKYGRSLREWQTPGYVASLTEYDDDIDRALTAITVHLAEQRGTPVRASIHLMAHSTGALIASLWANRNPGRVASLILNSPWLDVQGSAILRGATQGLLDPITRFRPKARLKLPEFGFYWRSISNAADGEWDVHPHWRPEFGFPIRAGWVAAILAGHAQVRRSLDIDVPVLVLASARSSVSPVWSDSMLTSDSVLDVTLMTQRALQLGSSVTVRRFEDALHDVLLSREPVRRQVYQTLDAWLRCQHPTGLNPPEQPVRSGQPS
ncbi:alpha/beta hydrolase [Arthrobacter sp. CAN_A1]|uniref:alpha/beta hydrolase n=1 Tax=Arthrobacter sp. CAN_A1 TaxID=2787717 RepID=UPI0018CAF383